LSWFQFWWELMRFCYARGNIQSTTNSHATLVLVWLGHESWDTKASVKRGWELQLSFVFDHKLLSTLINFELVQTLMRVDESLRYRAVISSQLSSTLMQLLFSFDRGMRAEKRQKTLVQNLASQLSSTFILIYNIQSTVINFHATLGLVWPGHESWENSRANCRFSTLILVYNIQSTLINSHATLVLVWPGHESWENSHANSRFSTLQGLRRMVYQTDEVSWTMVGPGCYYNKYFIILPTMN
jgi:hypothetical protein